MADKYHKYKVTNKTQNPPLTCPHMVWLDWQASGYHSPLPLATSFFPQDIPLSNMVTKKQ